MQSDRNRNRRWLLLLLVPLIALFPRGGVWDLEMEPALSLASGSFGQSVEHYVRDNLPFGRQLRQMGVTLRYLGGAREQNGVFLAGDTLIKNIDPPTESVVERNNEAVLEFAREMRGRSIPFYFTLIPTASGVRRQSLPAYASSFDQRRFIGDVYSQMTGKLTTVDSFLPLNTHRDQYIYCRTENNLTSFGGYYVYEAMAKRMKVTESPSYSDYTLTYGEDGFTGDLYTAYPYENIEPDVLIYFNYSRHVREYTVTHADGNRTRMYHSLYPGHLEHLGDATDTYLGGSSAVMDIKTSAPFNRRLLVFGDKTARTYLPFLVNHYQQVTLVDLFQGGDLPGGLTLEDYDQILMAYSVETYISPPATPAQVGQFLEE